MRKGTSYTRGSTLLSVKTSLGKKPSLMITESPGRIRAALRWSSFEILQNRLQPVTVLSGPGYLKLLFSSMLLSI